MELSNHRCAGEEGEDPRERLGREEASRDTGRSRWEAALAERRKAIGM